MADTITAREALAKYEEEYKGGSVAEAEKAIAAGHEAVREAWSKLTELREQLDKAEAHWKKCGADRDKAHAALGTALYHDRCVITLNKKILAEEEPKSD